MTGVANMFGLDYDTCRGMGYTCGVGKYCQCSYYWRY